MAITYYNTSRMGLSIPLRSGSKLVGPKASFEVDLEDDRSAAMDALRESSKAKEVTKKNFDDALKKVTPSLSRELQALYERFIERSRRIKIEETEKEHNYIG
jgi:hypothetical protein